MKPDAKESETPAMPESSDVAKPALPEATAAAERLAMEEADMERAGARLNARAAAIEAAKQDPRFEALTEAVYEVVLDRLWPAYLDVLRKASAAEAVSFAAVGQLFGRRRRVGCDDA